MARKYSDSSASSSDDEVKNHHRRRYSDKKRSPRPKSNSDSEPDRRVDRDKRDTADVGTGEGDRYRRGEREKVGQDREKIAGNLNGRPRTERNDSDSSDGRRERKRGRDHRDTRDLDRKKRNDSDSDDGRERKRHRDHRDTRDLDRKNRNDSDFDDNGREKVGRDGEKIDGNLNGRPRRERNDSDSSDGGRERKRDIDHRDTRDLNRKKRNDSDSSDGERERKRHRDHRDTRDLDRKNSDSDDGGRERKFERKMRGRCDEKEERRLERGITGKRERERNASDSDDGKRGKRGRERRGKRAESSDEEKRDIGRKERDRDGRDNGRRDRQRDPHSEKEKRERFWGHDYRDSRRKGEDDDDDDEDLKQKANPKLTVLQGGEVNADIGRSGGVYIPPFKLARMMKEVEDKSSIEYQRLTWDALRKSINGLVNKVNATNIKNIIPELFAENLVRGRGLFCRSCMKSQMASPGFTDVFAALVAVVNTKFPHIGELLLKRIILQLKRAYKRNDKPQLLAAVKFIAHLVNQQVAHELVALELLTLLLDKPTDDSVEVAVGFVTQCGSILQDLCPRGLHGIFESFRGILHEGEIDKRVQFLIEGLFAIRKAKFQGYPAVRPELDLVEQEDQFIHEVSLADDEEHDPETILDIFKPDPDFLKNEKLYEDLRKNILGDESEDKSDSDAGSDDEDDEESDEDEEEEEERMKIKDETETNLVNLRRTIYLTIMSSVEFEEAGHKLLKIKLEPGQEMELCIMLLECCSQERTYLRYYGLLGQRFCMINKVHQENFEKCFVQQYSMIHRLETNKLRNVAKFFAHLLGTDALPWHVLAYIRLTEEDTTSSSRIFIKILFQELSEHLGIRSLNERLNDPMMQDSFESIFPKDNPKNTRFSINFFTSIGLGGITENLREYLKNMPRLIMQQQEPAGSESDDDSGGSSGSSDSDASSSGSDSSSSSESESDHDRRRKRKRRS